VVGGPFSVQLDRIRQQIPTRIAVGDPLFPSRDVGIGDAVNATYSGLTSGRDESRLASGSVPTSPRQEVNAHVQEFHHCSQHYRHDLYRNRWRVQLTQA
jgi:hypothetical protein